MNIHYFTHLNNTGYRKRQEAHLYQARWEWMRQHVQGPALNLANTGDPWELREDWAALYNGDPAGRRHFQPNLIITHAAQVPKKIMHTRSRDTSLDRDTLYHQHVGCHHLRVIQLMPNLRNIYTIDHRSAHFLQGAQGGEVIHVPGFEGSDERSSGASRKTQGWGSVYERRKAYNILNKAREGYYSEEVNQDLIRLEDANRRGEFVNHPIWNLVKVHGGFGKTSRNRA